MMLRGLPSVVSRRQYRCVRRTAAPLVGAASLLLILLDTLVQRQPSRMAPLAPYLNQSAALYDAPRFARLSADFAELQAPPQRIIPRVVHQSYKTADQSRWPIASWRHCASSWRRHNPEWEYRFWTDEQNRQLFKEHLPQFLDLYDLLAKPVTKSDLTRFAYMYVHGGLYADLDMESVQSLDAPLAQGTPPLHEGVVLGMMGSDFNFGHSIPNAAMLSPARHPMWLHCLDSVRERLQEMHRPRGLVHVWWQQLQQRYDRHYNVYREPTEMLAGPVALKACVGSYVGAGFSSTGQQPQAPGPPAPPVYIAPPQFFFGLNWRCVWDNAGVPDCAPQEAAAWDMCGPYRAALTGEKTDAASGEGSDKFIAERKRCLDVLGPAAAALTFWGHSWGD
jgi:hypothetical protein